MPSENKTDKEKHDELRRHKAGAEDERGWAGQHGQRPGNQEEKNYRTGERRGEPGQDKKNKT